MSLHDVTPYATTAGGKLILSPEIITWSVAMGAWGVSTKEKALIAAASLASTEHRGESTPAETELDARRLIDYELGSALFDRLVRDASLIARTAGDWAALGAPADHPADTVLYAPAGLAGEIVAVHEGRHDRKLWSKALRDAQEQVERSGGLLDVRQVTMCFYVQERFGGQIR